MSGVATTIVNAKVFDGAERSGWTSVRFADGVITGDQAPEPGDEVVDAQGGTVLPGLIDTHVHLVPGALQQSLNHGVTTVLDMFSEPSVVATARTQARERKDVADVRSAGIGATAPGGHPAPLYPPFPTVADARQAERFVADLTADHLKVFSGVGGLWPALDDATMTALVAAAHARGLVVVGHVSSPAGVAQVVSAGVDVMAHVPAQTLGDALVRRIADAGIAVGPTLATVRNTLGAPLCSRAEDNLRRLAEAGVTLLAGTDAPNPGTVFGESLHQELELLVRCGVTPARALAAATSAAARVFGLTDRGRVAPGLRADLVLVSGEPLADITATRSVERIWRAGEECERRPFVPDAAEAAQLEAFDARIEKVVAEVRARRPR
ncbi:amidohydrolase family protein [Lentzea sp. NPDC059081]|uniref:amidohydrolase family protein n=1 Tax=Lentzea sp. NPDC059081 TaxID=3346719 RepID=UPI0036AAD5BC